MARNKSYIDKELENIFEINIPDEQIVITDDENKDYTLRLKIIFSNGKYFYIKPPSYRKYLAYVRDFTTLVSHIATLFPESQFLNNSELSKQENEIQGLLSEIIQKMQVVTFQVQITRRIEKILKKYFTFKNRFGFEQNAITLKEFRQLVTAPQLLLILSVLYNISDFIKKNITPIARKMGLIKELVEQSKSGRENTVEGGLTSFQLPT